MTPPYFEGHGVTLHHGDCLDVLRSLPDCSVDSVVTDPPYGLGFMGKEWDSGKSFVERKAAKSNTFDHVGGNHNPSNSADASRTRRVESVKFGEWCELWAAECLRVLKPGGHLLAFGGTRTWHRLACAVEDAGFEVRDSIAWMYGSGFPKSLDVSKAIDKRRHDGADICRVTAWVAATRTAAGVTNRDIDAAFGFNGMAGHWTTQGPQAAIPTLDQVPALLAVLGISVEDVPDEIRALLIDLNGMKGQPGPAWFTREVIGAGVSGKTYGMGGLRGVETSTGAFDLTAPATPDAERWQGWGTALKPGHEPVVCARKPFNTVPLGEEVDRLHHLIGGLLWLSLSPAKRAELASPSSPAGQHGARCASALVSAATATSPDGFAQTGMCSSPATASTSSSIASSWSSILGALSALTSTSTTSTRSSTTTALTTLSSLLAPLTSPSTMPPCACLTSGSSSSAPSAGSDSTDEWARWLHTLSASVPASAIEGTALVVASALAQVAASLSADQGAASSADPSATTGADASPSPAFEPVVVARKPLSGTVAATVLAHGTGALNIDGCRIDATDKATFPEGYTKLGRAAYAQDDYSKAMTSTPDANPSGRWPANVVLDESQAEALDEQSGFSKSPPIGSTCKSGASRFFKIAEADLDARFLYQAKAPKSERPNVDGTSHPTVKPLALMRWLVRLVTPPGGTVLEPFAGSGTTVEACIIEGFDCVAIEKGDEYLPLILERIARQDRVRVVSNAHNGGARTAPGWRGKKNGLQSVDS